MFEASTSAHELEDLWLTKRLRDVKPQSRDWRFGQSRLHVNYIHPLHCNKRYDKADLGSKPHWKKLRENALCGDMDYGVFSGETNLKVLAQGFAMIIASEIGDKTFLIAAILAMRHPRGIVFTGSFGALVLMSVLSAALGHVLPTLIPKSATQFAASILFFVFGVKMLMEGREMKGGNKKIEEEMREAEEEIEEDDAREESTGGVGGAGDAIPLEVLERGAGRTSASRTTNKADKTSIREGARNFFSLFLGPVFVQAFALTFLGEWGDRSQIATIALGAAHNVYIVSLGTIVGHSCCTAAAVIGGRYISTKISVKHVTLGGAALFILFGFIYLYEAFLESSDHVIAAPDPENPADLLH